MLRATLVLEELPDGEELDTWLSVDQEASEEAVGRGHKGHKRNAVVKALTLPLQRGGTKNTAIHVKVLAIVPVATK